jgi:hypothetical protein
LALPGRRVWSSVPALLPVRVMGAGVVVAAGGCTVTVDGVVTGAVGALVQACSPVLARLRVREVRRAPVSVQALVPLRERVPALALAA